MVVRRSGARRRRLVVDPSQAVLPTDNESAAPTAARRRKKSEPKPDLRAYSYGADRRNHHKTTDLIPKRVLSYLLLTLAIVTSLAMLNYGAMYAPQMKQQIGSQGVSSLAMLGQGSVANWFSSFLLIMTGLASLQIYALRQHRCDDYGGTYRLWLWMAALFLIASVNCVANIGGVLVHAVQSLTQQSLTQNPWMLIGIKIALLSALVARGIYEVRQSRGSVAWVVLVWIGYAGASLMQLPAAEESLSGVVSTEMVMGNCVLVGTIALFMAHITYARFIFLHAHGLIRLRERKVAKPKKAAAKKTKAKAKRKKTTKKKAAGESEEESDSDVASTRKSKAKTKTAAKKSTKTTTQSRSADSTSEEEPVEKRSVKKSKKQKTVTSLTSSNSKEDKTKSGGLGNRHGEKSPQDVLKELAAASRAKERTKSQSNDAYEEDEQETEGIIKMSKAQRRKQRKAQRNRKRAA